MNQSPSSPIIVLIKNLTKNRQKGELFVMDSYRDCKVEESALALVLHDSLEVLMPKMSSLSCLAWCLNME